MPASPAGIRGYSYSTPSELPDIAAGARFHLHVYHAGRGASYPAGSTRIGTHYNCASNHSFSATAPVCSITCRSAVFDVPLGTAIRNSAGIYFDFNEPVITNTTLHTVQEHFLTAVDVKDVAVRPGLELNVFPNPVSHSAQFQLISGGIERGLLQVWNAQGQLVGTQPFSGDQTTWNASGMRQGLYFFQIVSGGQTVASGKMLVRR